MNPQEQSIAVFFGFVAFVCFGSLFLPIVQRGTSSSGLSGALGIPAWGLAAGAGVVFTLFVVLLFVNARRRKNGRPPL